MGKKFTKNTRQQPQEYEAALVARWKENKTFEKSVDQRSTDNSYVFYDGPPFITGVPHHGTLISSIVKDVVPRFWAMKGKRVERVWGWDCHGLPAEVYTEKKLGIKGKDEIHDYGLEKYICATRENMVETSGQWEDTIDRIGRWVDFGGAYKTMDNEYMESVWWAFKELHSKGKIYEGERVLMYCTQDATPLSKAEVTMDSGAYQDVTDPSVFVRFALTKESLKKLKLDDQAAMLAWTTTPWTLLANTALAVNKEFEYSVVEVAGQQLILATELIGAVLVDSKNKPVEFKLVATLAGEQLAGLDYEPLFSDQGEGAHRIHHADYVSLESGSGLVHIAPAYGEEDFELAQKAGVPVVHSIDETGHFTDGPWKGQYVWDINKQIAKDMKRYSIKTLTGEYSDMDTDARIAFHGTSDAEPDAPVWKIDYIKHSYPHCHRCDTKLMYRAHPSWFMNIADQREDMLAQNSDDINWFPAHIKHGRFQKTVESAPDWNLSRDRFWATPMPVWESVDAKGEIQRIVVGSFDELEELSGTRLDDYHRPWIDDVVIEKDGLTYKRVEKVMDCWFESGSMPFAQFHYPFENKQKFEDNFPGDFISEYVGQVRAWFYYLHAISTGLFGTSAFKNVVMTGNVMGDDGYKLSKSRGNFTDPNEVMDATSADALRFTLISSNLLNGEDFMLQDKAVGDVQRKLNMVWNMYDFFTLYAEVDGWEFDGQLNDPYHDLSTTLDRWIVSRVHETTTKVEQYMLGYDIPNASRQFIDLIEDASNWYVRRSRKRFWKSENDGDKNDAYRTLHYVLAQISIVSAPFVPFMADQLYRDLTDGESVHLLDWPEVGHVNELLIQQMGEVRSAINEGLGSRAKNQLKVRQPLASATVHSSHDLSEYQDVIAEELNVKQVICEIDSELSVELDLELTDELRLEGVMRELIRQVQSFRKGSGLNIEDKIRLAIGSQDGQIKLAVKTHADEIEHETLAVEISEETDSLAHTKIVKIEGKEVHLALEVLDGQEG